MKRTFLSFIFGIGVTAFSCAADFPPDAFLEKYCFECHDDLTQKGEIQLDDAIDRDWTSHESQQFFERVKNAIESGEMPPEKADAKPTQTERDEVTKWLHGQLMTHSKIGGTVLRRLNQTEYENTVRKSIGISFKAPDGFPADQSFHGFDNIGEGLVLSPPLLEAYHEAAVSVADEIFPPDKKPVASQKFTVKPDEMVISYSSGQVVDGAMRLASKSDPVSRSCSWPSKFEAKGSGKYKVQVTLSAVGVSEAKPAKFELRAKPVSTTDSANVLSLRKLAEWNVTSETAKTFEAEVEIYSGETVIFYWANAPLDSDRGDKNLMETYYKKRFKEDPKLMAAWMAIKHDSGIRGGVGWERVKEKLADPNLDTSNADVESEAGKKLIKTMLGNPVLYVETISYDLFENGPNVGVHELIVEGPSERVEDDDDRRRKRLKENFMAGTAALTGRVKIEAVMQRFLTSIFRRPASEKHISDYADLIEKHATEKGRDIEDGYHLAIRTALMSPDFLYRESKPGTLDDYDLASRLAYFLTSAPPDAKLFDVAAKGRLTMDGVLGFQAGKLLESGASKEFVKNFTGQWLHTRKLPDIMPDPRLLNVTSANLKELREETEMLFAEILKKNLPIETFIDPDFTFLSIGLANKFYGLKNVKSKKMTRVSLPKDSPYGGVLGMAAVMMATANGVDTQPVERGVWALENVLGSAPPPPPKNVPAITPDTRGSKTVRDLLEAHRADENCAGCHRKIDPVGFVLENFDPVGRWRTHYPIYDKDGKAKNGIKIDATGTLNNGTELTHINDLKADIVKNIDVFATCLGEKLMTYATGRELSYADRHEINLIAKKSINDGHGFRDFFFELIKSETFRTK